MFVQSFELCNSQQSQCLSQCVCLRVCVCMWMGVAMAGTASSRQADREHASTLTGPV